MWQEEINSCLKLCRLNIEEKSSLTPYLRLLTCKHVSESIKYKILASQVCIIEYYDGHRVPLPATLLKTIKNRKYISEDPDLNYHTAQKGLIILVLTLLDENEILSINKLHEYISGTSLTSPEDINKLSKLTSKLINTMEMFMEQLKVIENLLSALFATSSPLFLELKSIIC